MTRFTRPKKCTGSGTLQISQMPSYIASRSNQSVERTATRRAFTFQVIKLVSAAATLTLGGGSSLLCRWMLMRVVAVMLLLSAGIAVEAMPYSFVSKASGRLGGPIRFEFYRDSTTRPKTDIESFTVSIRTADDRWKAMWSI